MAMTTQHRRIKMKQNKDGSISITWNIEDVQELEPKMSDEQAMEVLELALDNHDANVGINWGVLEFWISQVYKENDDD
jgi:hypothetical protein|tara:strand:+ start:135 stop:368 length:234 start_codon:yes stop_codon:yes gene_type:complete